VPMINITPKLSFSCVQVFATSAGLEQSLFKLMFRLKQQAGLIPALAVEIIDV